MLHVVATIELHEGKRGDFLKEFDKLVPLVRAEAGCLEYGPTIDVETGIKVQTPVRHDTVIVLEKWNDLDALTAHLAAPHMAAYRETTKDYVKSIALEVLAAV